MNITVKAAIGSLLAATSMSPALAQSQVHNASAEFGAPQWVYGQRSGPACATAGPTMASAYTQFPGATGRSGTSPQPFIPLVAKTGSAQLVASTVNIPANTLWMHPGAGDVCASLGYKGAPGAYSVAITMKPVDTTGPNHVRGYIYAGGVLQGTVEDLFASGGSKSFSRSVMLSAPGTIEFVLDAGGEGNGFYSDSTSVDMVVTRIGRPRGVLTEEAGGIGAGALGASNAGTGDNEVGDNGGFPVLNCSQSQNNPPSLNLSTGQPGWSVVLPGGGTSSVVPAANVSWSAVPGSAWVGPAGAPQTVGIYAYSTRVKINACPNGRAAMIDVVYRADNTGTLLIDGAVVQTQAGTPNYGFLPASQTVKTFAFPVGTSGVHTITLRVQNTGSVTGVTAKVTASR